MVRNTNSSRTTSRQRQTRTTQQRRMIMIAVLVVLFVSTLVAVVESKRSAFVCPSSSMTTRIGSSCFDITPRQQQQERPPTSCFLGAVPNNNSNDDEDFNNDDIDIQQAEPLVVPTVLRRAAKNNPETIRRNLELNWKLMQSIDECDLEDDIHSCGGICEECDGEGLVECRFCSGTGFFMIGDDLIRVPVGAGDVGDNTSSSGSTQLTSFISSGGRSKPCPVCNGNGEEECKGCMGRQYVAKWRQFDPNHLLVDGNEHTVKDNNDEDTQE